MFIIYICSLVCEVSYQIGSGEPLTSSRYYKFQVLKPLDVKTKFYNAEVSFNFKITTFLCILLACYKFKLVHPQLNSTVFSAVTILSLFHLRTNVICSYRL